MAKFNQKQLPTSKVYVELHKPTNRHLLNYVTNDAFGAHIFPGDIAHYTVSQFLFDLNAQLTNLNPIHLWINLPTCEKRCFFCQYPIAIARNPERLYQSTQKWLEANLKEARLWLEAVPMLKYAPIGEFNILGGTPTLLSNEQIDQLISFYRNNFNFKSETTLRIEGTASTYTFEKLNQLKKLGVSKVSTGIQSFDDKVLAQANCSHTSKDAFNFIKTAHKLNFKSVNTDFIYGLLDQTLEQFLTDIKTAIDLKVSCIVISKLHLKTFAEERTAVSGFKEALWQIKSVRQQLKLEGHHWPTLNEQYQMRELAVELLEKHGYREHPTMFFYHPDASPEKWKSLVVDQDKQFAEIGIGMGGSSCCTKAEVINMTKAENYFAMIDRGVLPIESVRGFTEEGIQKKSLKMALSSCQPLQNSLFQKRFPGHSIFKGNWKKIFNDLENRNLVTMNYGNETIELTPIGRTLVEAIIHTEF